MSEDSSISDISFEAYENNEPVAETENLIVEDDNINPDSPVSNGDMHAEEGAPPNIDDLLDEDIVNEEMSFNRDGQSIDEIMILDPTHPLMIRFQKQLHEHLSKQHEKCVLESATLEEQLKKSKDKREEIGVRLYGRQQDLAMQQANLEEMMEYLSEKSLMNETIMYQIDEQRAIVSKLIEKQTEESKNVSKLLKEADILSLKLFYVEKAHDCQSADVSVIHRTVDKASKEIDQHQIDKQTQDFFLNRMSEEAARIEKELDTLNVKLVAQKSEKEAVQDILRDACVEIKKAETERGKIVKQWNSALFGMSSRNNMYSEMMDSINNVKQNIMTCQREIQHSKNSTDEKQVKNEQLTQIMHRIQVVIANTNKQLGLEHNRYECLKVEYSTYSAMLQETENGLTKCNYSYQHNKKVLESLVAELEKEHFTKINLEKKIKTKVQERMFVSKAAKYSKKSSLKLSDQTQELESEISKIDNKIAERILEKFEADASILVNTKKMDEFEKTISVRNGDITLSETQVSRRMRVIERKQQAIQLLNKNLENLIEHSGGLELSPIERQMHHYKIDINSKEEEIKSMQNSWLRNQRQLVHFSDISEQDKKQTDSLMKQFTVLSKKKIRIERNIDNELKEIFLVERDVVHMQADIEKLNALVCGKRKCEEELMTNTVLKEKDFLKKLKESECEAIKMENKLASIKTAKEQIFRDLIESEKEILLLEKKNKLTKESKDTVKQDVDHGEIKAMKCEIHRMEVALKQLKQQLENLVQETEKAVSRRETIYTKGQIMSRDRLGVNAAINKINELIRKMKELKQEIKTLKSEEIKTDQEIEDAKMGMGTNELTTLIESKKISENEMNELLIEKPHVTNFLIRLQKRGKNFDNVISGKYKRRIKSADHLEEEYKQEIERRDKLIALADSLNEEYPQLTSELKVINKLVQII